MDSHESLSLSPAGRMTMKMDILEGFSLALLTRLNAYNIITKGGKKRMFSGKKKKYNPNTKILHGTQTNETHFCKLFMVELAVLLKQVKGIRLSMSSKARSCPET